MVRAPGRGTSLTRGGATAEAHAPTETAGGCPVLVSTSECAPAVLEEQGPTQELLLDLDLESVVPASASPASALAVTMEPESLSDTEALSVLLAHDDPQKAERVLAEAGGLWGLLQMGPADLHGMGLSQREADQVRVVLELARRSQRRLVEAPILNSPSAAGNYLLHRTDGWTEERFGILVLNAKTRLMADRIISHGTVSATLVGPREVYREALKYGAASILVWHNHPSGDPSPSREDVALTRRLQSAGAGLGVPLADHLILGGGEWYSFRKSERWDSNLV